MTDIHSNGHDLNPPPEFAPENGGSPAPAEEKRGRGRPKGSRNKVSSDARRLIAEHGLGAVKTLCKIAAGQTIYAAPDGSGKRERIVPSLDQRISAARVVLDRLVPSLKASEVTADVRSTSMTDVFLRAPGETVEDRSALAYLDRRIAEMRDRIPTTMTDRDL